MVSLNLLYRTAVRIEGKYLLGRVGTEHLKLLELNII